MANCVHEEMKYLHNACDEELKQLNGILRNILNLEGIDECVLYDYLSDFELELSREIIERFCSLEV